MSSSIDSIEKVKTGAVAFQSYNKIALYLLDLLCDECLPIMASGKAKMKRLKMKKFGPVISK